MVAVRLADGQRIACGWAINAAGTGATALAARIPLQLADGRLEAAADCTLSLADSRLMVCGNPDLAKELRQFLSERGYATNRRGVPGQMAFEKYW